MPDNKIETTTIGDGPNALHVPRLLTGLWQLAGVEADDGKLKELASGLQPYVDSGLAAFDMADRKSPSVLFRADRYQITE